MPRITQKLTELESERGELQAERETYEAGYWDDQRLSEEAQYMTIVKDLTASILKLMAIDNHTVNDLPLPKVGRGLYCGLRHNECFQVPAKGNYATSMSLAPFHDVRVKEELGHLEAVFDDAVRTRVENVG